jgi:hypothetical protein
MCKHARRCAASKESSSGTRERKRQAEFTTPLSQRPPASLSSNHQRGSARRRSGSGMSCETRASSRWVMGRQFIHTRSHDSLVLCEERLHSCFCPNPNAPQVPNKSCTDDRSHPTMRHHLHIHIAESFNFSPAPNHSVTHSLTGTLAPPLSQSLIALPPLPPTQKRPLWSAFSNLKI